MDSIKNEILNILKLYQHQPITNNTWYALEARLCSYLHAGLVFGTVIQYKVSRDENKPHWMHIYYSYGLGLYKNVTIILDQNQTLTLIDEADTQSLKGLNEL